jgi:hypothetical protein
MVGINKSVSTKRGSEIFFGSRLDTDLPDGLFLRKALPSSAIDHHLQSPDIDFIAPRHEVLSRAAIAHAPASIRSSRPSEAADLRGFVNRLSRISQSR